MPTKEQIDLFWSNVDRSGKCWLWKRYVTAKGYGKVGFGNRILRAHRVAWIIAKGNIPDGLLVMHKCDNPPCVRPSHIRLGTPKQNTRDAMKKGRLNFRGLHRIGKDHCMAKLTEGDVKKIRLLHSGGLTFKTIANRFCISGTHAARVARSEAWTHI